MTEMSGGTSLVQMPDRVWDLPGYPGAGCWEGVQNGECFKIPAAMIPYHTHGHLGFETLTVLQHESSLTLEMLIANVQVKGKRICALSSAGKH
jgi:hypothetical protein